MAYVGAANGALILTKWARGDSKSAVESTVPSVRLGITQSLARDAAWILNGVADIIATITAPSLADESKPDKLRGGGGRGELDPATCEGDAPTGNSHQHGLTVRRSMAE